MKRRLLLLPLLAVCLLAGGLFRRGATPFNLSAEIGADAMNREVDNLTDNLIDEKARKAQDADEAAIRELADEVFASSHFGLVPEYVLAQIKERVVAHELKYREDKKGLNEKGVVRMVNGLADKLGAPEYAKTSPLQVHALRARLMTGYPNLISPADASGKKGLRKGVGSAMNADMSPLEAVFVAGVLLEQKMINEEFQHAPTEWDEKLSKKQLKNWQHAEKRRGSRQPERPQIAVLVNRKAKQLREIISQSPARMSPVALASIVDDSLDELGIER